jgi:hypothetical protein
MVRQRFPGMAQNLFPPECPTHTHTHYIHTQKKTQDELESYLEPLYDHEEGPAADAAKVQGTSMVLELTRDAGNIEALMQDPALLGALSRVLADDAPRGGASPAMLYNVLRLFVVFSNFYEARGLFCHVLINRCIKGCIV